MIKMFQEIALTAKWVSNNLKPELSDSNFGFCGMARWGLPAAWAAAILPRPSQRQQQPLR
jgi:hypothetical protein